MNAHGLRYVANLLAAVALTSALACTGVAPSAGNGADQPNENTGNQNVNAGNDNSGNGNENANSPDNGNEDGDANAVSGAFDAAAGLRLTAGAFEMNASPTASPSSATLSMRVLSEAELTALGLPPGNGFEHGVTFEPSGTTFASPVEVTVELANVTVLETLPVLRYDEETRAWGDAGVIATVEAGGTRARFELNSFSTYSPWNPPLPPGDVPIGEGEIIAGTGLFEGQPFSLFPNYTNTSASLTYSAFGDVFALSLINVDLENPTTGDNITLTAGLHSSEVRILEQGVVLGLVTPAGGLSGPSIYSDGTSMFVKPVAGVMYLRKTDTQWKVDAYCYYENGIIFGQAVGELE